jgi:PKD repeat protein
MRHTDAVWGVDRNTPNHVYTKPGDYFVRLTVTDDSGSADTVTQTVAIVGNEIQPPVASLVATPDTAREGAGIGFDASGSQAPGSTIGSYAWRFGDGKSRIGELTSHVYPHAGTYTVTLTIITANALTDTTTRKVHIVRSGPHASLSVSPRHPRRGQLVAFLGAATDWTVVAYRWAFGDRTHGTGAFARHSYRRRGRYHVTLRVTDSNGSTATRTTTVTVGR